MLLLWLVLFSNAVPSFDYSLCFFGDGIGSEDASSDE